MQTTIDTYNRAAEAYAQKFNSIGSRRVDVERAFALFGGDKTAPVVVEWGCGNGRDASVILEFTTHFVGIDASHEMIELAKADLPDANLQVADISTFEIPHQTDIIFAFASLLHLDKKAIQDVLEKQYEHISSGGIIYLSLKRAPYEEKIVIDDFGSRTFYYYERKDIEEFSKGKYELVFYKEHEMKGVNWLIAALRKI